MIATRPSYGEELERARETVRAARCNVAVLSSIANVTYVSGVEVPVPVGAGAELTYGPWLAVLSVGDGGAALVVPDSAVEALKAQVVGFEIVGFAGFDSFNQTDSRGSYLNALRAALHAAGLGTGKATVGVEERFLPYLAGRLLAEEFTQATVVEAESALQQARLIKTPREIALLRRASHLADIAHTTLASQCREAGRSEFDMYAEIAARTFEAAGRDMPLTGELVTGPRTTVVQYPNGPRARTTDPGDVVLMDLSGRYDGYWFDCTNTHVVGGMEPNRSQIRFAHASQDACEAAIAALRPGALARDAAAAAATAFAKHGLPMAHYAGHQIGVAVNELPRLVPYDQTPIEAGMVFAVEPGAYEGPGGTLGARSEKMILVTSSGPEILSTFQWGI